MLPGLLRSTRASLEPERLNEMSNQVSQLFPHIPIDLIQQDLRLTHSIEITVENILEDRLAHTNARTNQAANNNLDIEETDGDDEDEEFDENTSSEDDHRQVSNEFPTRPVNRRRNNFIS